jgi:hypothetical protein
VIASAPEDPMAFDLATIDVITPEHYEQNGYPHPEWAYLRRHAPCSGTSDRASIRSGW